MGTTIIIGFASGVFASFVGRSFTLSIVLGIAVALGAIFLGQKIGWYQTNGTALIEAAATATVVPVIGRLFLGLANMSYMDG